MFKQDIAGIGGGGGLEFSAANRQMSTEAIARLLGLEYMIPHSEFAIIRYNNQELRGTLMCIAEGVSTNRISSKRANDVVSPALQRDLA